VIGRSNECDITLGVAHLSRRHARLILSGEQLEVEDLRSSNGTYVNGKQVQRSLLRDGDELSFDTLTFSVMGASDDSDSTMLRPQQDIHKTTVRPAIKTSDVVKAPKPRSSGNPKAAARKSTGSTQNTQSVPTQSKGSGHGSANIIVAVVVVAIVAVAAWFLL